MPPMEAECDVSGENCLGTSFLPHLLVWARSCPRSSSPLGLCPCAPARARFSWCALGDACVHVGVFSLSLSLDVGARGDSCVHAMDCCGACVGAFHVMTLFFLPWSRWWWMDGWWWWTTTAGMHSHHHHPSKTLHHTSRVARHVHAKKGQARICTMHGSSRGGSPAPPTQEDEAEDPRVHDESHHGTSGWHGGSNHGVAHEYPVVECQYQLLEEIGQGASATVRASVHSTTQQQRQEARTRWIHSQPWMHVALESHHA